MRRFFALLAFAVFAGPAAACINDAELPYHEREFRSQYRGTETPSPASSTPTTDYLLFGAGGMLAVGAVAVTLTNRRRGG